MIYPFTILFSARIREHAKVLLVGAILSPAELTVTAVLRVLGLSGEKYLQTTRKFKATNLAGQHLLPLTLLKYHVAPISAQPWLRGNDKV